MGDVVVTVAQRCSRDRKVEGARKWRRSDKILAGKDTKKDKEEGRKRTLRKKEEEEEEEEEEEAEGGDRPVSEATAMYVVKER